MQSSLSSDSTSPISSHNPDDWPRMIVEASPNGIIVAERGGGIVLTNEKAQALFGYTADEFELLKIEDLVPKRLQSVHVSHRDAYHLQPEARAMGEGRDLRAVRKDGSEFPVEIGLTPLPIEGRELVLSSIVDITTRKEAERQLHDYADELKFQAEILNNVHDAVFYLDGDALIREWNEGAKRLFGHTSAEIIGQHVSQICIEDRRWPSARIDEKIKKEGMIEDVVHCKDSSGRDVTVKAVVRVLDRDGKSGYLVCARDITERLKLKAELLRVAEDQQRKIGQYIHDDLCSQLSGIGCMTKVLENQLVESRRAEAEMMKNICEMVANAGTTARQIVHGLVPSILENQGLAEALAELIRVNQNTYGIDIRLSISDKNAISAIDKEIGIQIFRIAQEAVSNAVLHSEAELIRVTAIIRKHRLEMTIQDGGKGMSEDLVIMGLGLATMRRRAALIHADFDIVASPGKGTTISCSVPLSSR